MSSKKSNTKNVKVPAKSNLNSSKKNKEKKSYLTILYTPMGLALGLVYGVMTENQVNGLLGGLFIGGGIDFLISRYKKKYNL